MPEPKAQASARETLSRQAYLAIKDQILHGQLPLGAVVSRRKLASELGMSMLPVCTAIQRLELDELLESKPRVGTRVRIPAEEDIRERHTIREALECQSARLVSQNATLQQRQELLHIAQQLDALYRRSASDHDPEFLFALHGYHMQLHLRIAEFSGIAALREMIEKNNLLVFNWLYDLVTPLPPRFHSDLLVAVTGRDVEAAERAMRMHVQSGQEETIRAFASARTNPGTRWRRRAASAKEEGIPAQASPAAPR